MLIPFGVFSAGAGRANSYELISTTIATGSEAVISFTSIPATYKHLQIRATTRTTYAGGFGLTASMSFNSDGAANYSWHWLYGDGGSVATNATANAASIGNGWTGGSSMTANMFSGTIIDILDYANTNKYKTSRTLTGTAAGGIFLTSGNWRNTAAISTIGLFSAGNWASGTRFSLYGIKG